MNDRRDFLKKSALVAGGIVVAGFKGTHAHAGTFPAGIVYTSGNPGIWAKKAGSHAPKVNVEGKKITITTMHPMTEKHYIVRHTLVSQDGKVLGEKTFYPTDKKAVSTYDLSSDHGTGFYATSFCNLHDFWLTEFTVK